MIISPSDRALDSLSKEAFDTDRGLWLATQEQELYPNPHSYAREATQLSWYTFIGRILGKALYDGILIDVRFASFFLSKVSSRASTGVRSQEVERALTL